MPRAVSQATGFVNVVVTGDTTAVQAALLRLEIALAPPGLAHFLGTMVEPYLQTRAINRFASEGDDVSGRWAPLAPFTENIRRSQGYGAAHPINRRTGKLENYITNTPGTITTGGDVSRLKFPGATPTGELRDKVRVAQVGDPGTKGSPMTPARPVLGMNATDLEAILVGLAMHMGDYF